jgi:hypothetical protein
LERQIELHLGGYVSHSVYVRDLPSGDLSLVFECEIGGQVRSRWMVLVLADDGWRSSELWSEPNAPQWWYGYANEGALVNAVLSLL